MRRTRVVIAAAAVMIVLAGCSSGGGADDAASTTTEAPASTTTTDDGVVEMSIPDATESASPAAEGAASGTVIMLKLHVGDVDDATTFYETVFGATTAYELGDGIRVLTMADGPGFILIEDAPGEADEWNGSFLIQVPDLAAAVALAEENGATSEQAFEGSPGGQEARSVDLLDPWGNQIEILQLD
ncbi:MAG: VOC family protein [Acidimicrobiales bacterium]|nr:VOC family protein [Acidimicrobiales bacterium]